MHAIEPIAEHGLFWLRDNEQRKLWGTLHVNEANESKLETFGSLIGPEEEGLHTILGQIRSGQELVTLIDCFPTNTLNPWSSRDGQTDWSRQICHVNGVVEGIGFEKGEAIAFEQATLTISTLPDWADPNIVKIYYPKVNSSHTQVTVSIEDRPDESTTVNFGKEEVKISLRFRPKQESGRRGVITRYLIEDHCQLIIERADGSRMPLELILGVARAMRDLLSICCNETPTVNSIIVRYDNNDPRPAKVHVGIRGNEPKSKEGLSCPPLNLKAIGGMGGVTRWFEESDRYGEAVAFLTSNWYNQMAYNEDRFSRMYTAVEGLIYRKKKCKQANMKSADLGEFVKKAIASFSTLTNTLPEEWANQVKRIRDQKISHSDPGSSVRTDGRTIHVMTNVLYVAGASFLLREMGIGENQVEEYVNRCSRSLLLSKPQ